MYDSVVYQFPYNISIRGKRDKEAELASTLVVFPYTGSTTQKLSQQSPCEQYKSWLIKFHKETSYLYENSAMNINTQSDHSLYLKRLKVKILTNGKR